MAQLDCRCEASCATLATIRMMVILNQVHKCDVAFFVALISKAKGMKECGSMVQKLLIVSGGETINLVGFQLEAKGLLHLKHLCQG